MKSKAKIVRRVLLTIVGIFAMCLAIYGIWSMAYWNLNPADWHGPARFALGVLYFAVLVAGAIDIMTEMNGEGKSAKRSEYSRQAWSNKMPLIRSYAEGTAIEFNSGMVGSGNSDHWIEVGDRCSFDWPAHYYRRSEQTDASDPPPR